MVSPATPAPTMVTDGMNRLFYRVNSGATRGEPPLETARCIEFREGRIPEGGAFDVVYEEKVDPHGVRLAAGLGWISCAIDRIDAAREFVVFRRLQQ